MEIGLRDLGSSSSPRGRDALISLGKGNQAAAGVAGTPRDKRPAGPGLRAEGGLVAGARPRPALGPAPFRDAGSL